MEFKYIHWKQNQPIAEDYVHAFKRVSDLFEYHHTDPDAYSARAQWLDQHAGMRANPAEVAAALNAYQERIGNHPNALRSIAQLTQPQTLAVVGGQQAGLFSGQLLVIHKAISIIRTTRRASEQLGRPVVPIFWIAGEDHDFQEVNHTLQLSNTLSLTRIELPEREEHQGKRLTISRRAVSIEEWEQAINELEAQLQQTEFKPGLIDTLRQTAAESASLSEMFARIIAQLFGESGLIVLDSDDPELRQVEAKMFTTIITHNAEVERALHAAAAKQQSLGYTPSAEVRERSANLFYSRDGERIALYRDEAGDFQDRSGELRFRADELQQHAQQSPDSFSNNVFTRPLMQDYLFPVLTTVLGPGEISYWGLTRETFRALDMQMPIITPRLEFTLVEGTVKKQLDKLDLSLEDAFFHIEEKRDQWLAAQDSLGISEQFAQVKQQFDALYDPILQLVASINPGLKALGETNHQKITEQISFLENRAKDAHENQFDAAKRQFERIRMSLAPLGKRQERVYNIYAYLNRYGYDWLSELLIADYEENGQHIVVYL